MIRLDRERLFKFWQRVIVALQQKGKNVADFDERLDMLGPDCERAAAMRECLTGFDRGRNQTRSSCDAAPLG